MKKEDTYIDYQPDDILTESSAVVSHRHCSQLCTADANCTAVNYNHDTSNCQLLSSKIVSLIAQSGSTVYMDNEILMGMSQPFISTQMIPEGNTNTCVFKI